MSASGEVMVSYSPKLTFGFDRLGNRVKVPFDRLATHVHCVATTGGGKTRFCSHLVGEVLRKTDATVVVCDPKGDLADLVVAKAIEGGSERELLVWDFRETSVYPGYDPLAQAGIAVEKRAAFASEATRAAWGQATFDATPRLDRYLFLAYAAACQLGLGLRGAFELLRVDGALRERVLPYIRNWYVGSELAQLDALPPSRREEVTESATSRLGKFLSDPLISRMLEEEQHVLDLDDVLFGPRRRILVMNFASPQAVTADACRLLSRYFLNDLLCRRLSRGVAGARRPTVLFLDELGYLITPALCQAFEWGRAFGICVVAAHQHLAQLGEEDRMLEYSVLANARTKIVIGGPLVEDLERLAPELALTEYDPLKVKDQIWGLELDPVESTREVSTYSHTVSDGETTPPVTVTEGDNWSEGEGQGGNRTVALTHARSKSRIVTDGTTVARATSRMAAEIEGEGDVIGTTNLLTDSSGQAIATLSDGAGAITDSASSTLATGGHEGRTTHRGSVYGEGESNALAHQHSVAEQDGEQRGITVGTGENWSHQANRGGHRDLTRGTEPGTSHVESEAQGFSVQPFYEYKKRYVVTSREFESREEFLTKTVQALKRQPVGHLALKVPGHPLVYLRAPRVRDPILTPRQLSRALARIYEQPCYRDLKREPIRERRPVAALRRRRRPRKLPATDKAWDC